jgi:hypothetical protein
VRSTPAGIETDTNTLEEADTVEFSYTEGEEERAVGSAEHAATVSSAEGSDASTLEIQSNTPGAEAAEAAEAAVEAAEAEAAAAAAVAAVAAEAAEAEVARSAQGLEAAEGFGGGQEQAEEAFPVESSSETETGARVWHLARLANGGGAFLFLGDIDEFNEWNVKNAEILSAGASAEGITYGADGR